VNFVLQIEEFMKRYAVEIYFEGNVLRFSTEPYTEVIEIEGRQSTLSYFPHILSVDLGESSISIEGAGSIPTVSISLWDGNLFLFENFSDVDYESADVKIYDIGEGKVEIFSGYLTEFSQTDNTAKFTVRLDERLYLKDGLWKKFTANTFQNFDIRKPLRVDLATSWMRREDMTVEIAGCPVWTSNSKSDLSISVGEVPAVSNSVAAVLDFNYSKPLDSQLNVVIDTLDKFDIPIYGSALYGDLDLDIISGIIPEGSIWSWGDSNDIEDQFSEQSVKGRRASSFFPYPEIVSRYSEWQEISCGHFFSLAIASEGTLWAWGLNDDGRTGLNRSSGSVGRPTKISEDRNWKNISAGQAHSLAIKEDGSLWSWGRNSNGQLGLGSTSSRGVLTPSRVGFSNDWEKISAGGNHSLAIKTDGTLWAWGSNLNGRTGLNLSSGVTSSPIKIGEDSDWKHISAGWDHSIAIKTDGTIWAWGNNDSGQLGNNSTLSLTQPNKIGSDNNWASVSCGYKFSIAIKTNNSIYSCGSNSRGKTGLGVLLSNTPSFTRIGNQNDWAYVSAGYEYCLAIKSDSSLWGWGDNTYGQIGAFNFRHISGSATFRSYLAQSFPYKIGGSEQNWVKVSAGRSHSLAIRSSMSVGLDGENVYPDLRQYYLRPVFNFSKDPLKKGIVLSWEETFATSNSNEVEKIYLSSGAEEGDNFAAIGWPNSRYYEIFKYRIANHSKSDNIPDLVSNNSKRLSLTYCETLGGNSERFATPGSDLYNRFISTLLFNDQWTKMVSSDKFVPITPIRFYEGELSPVHSEVIVKTNLFAPPDVLTNPDYSLGYLMFDPQFKDNIRFLSSDVRSKSRSKREKIFRYRIIDADIIDGVQHLKLEIHNSKGMNLDAVKKEIIKRQSREIIDAGSVSIEVIDEGVVPLLTPIESDRDENYEDKDVFYIFDNKFRVVENLRLSQKFNTWNSYLDHKYYYNNAQALDIFPNPIEVSIDEKFIPMSPNRQVKRIDFQIDIPGIDVKNANYSKLKNRLKGRRVEVIKNFQSMVQDLGLISNSGSSDSDINLNIINNITGEFAVVRNSRVFYNNSISALIERVNFDVEGGQSDRDVITVSQDDSKDTQAPDLDRKFINLLSYNAYNSRLSGDEFNHEEVYGIEAARLYFLRQQYRIINDPVPPGSKELGKFFPMMYGYVKKYPMMQVISSDVTMESAGQTSAGNDVYIFSSNPCNISDDSDIVINLEDEDGRITEAELGFSVLWPHIIQSPFPNVLKDHNYKIRDKLYSGDINTPYHRVDSFETLYGDLLYGIKLRGYEWDETMGISDKRFPIRNGVGTTNLLIDVPGAFDKTSGQTYLHPCDIIINFIKDNCEFPYSENIIDLDSFQRVKGLTRFYLASIPLPEETTPFQLLDSICRQFGYFWHLNYGRIYIGILDLFDIEYDKFISEAGDIVGRVSEIDEGYKNTYSKIEYNYFKDWSKNSFRYSINLDKDNNKYCAVAAMSKGGKGVYKVDADYVTDMNVAIDVSSRLAKYLSRRRKVYTCQIKKSGIGYLPGEVVQISYSPLNLRYDEVLITSVKDLEAIYEINFIKFF
jgi:alpha-tubulin suppressor-like RCC1 family protein